MYVSYYDIITAIVTGVVVMLGVFLVFIKGINYVRRSKRASHDTEHSDL